MTWRIAQPEVMARVYSSLHFNPLLKLVIFSFSIDHEPFTLEYDENHQNNAINDDSERTEFTEYFGDRYQDEGAQDWTNQGATPSDNCGGDGNDGKVQGKL